MWDDLDLDELGAFPLFEEPPAAESSLLDNIGWNNVMSGVASVASAASDIISKRDAFTAAADQRAYDRTLKSAQLDLARYQVQTGAAVEKAKADTLLAQARNQFNAAAGVVTSNAGSMLPLLLIGGVLFVALRK